MGVGPAGRTGRDQVAEVRTFLAAPARRAGEIVAICCAHAATPSVAALDGASVTAYPIDCAGNLHTSVIELLLRGGASGVVVLACPPRDCRHREGPRWLVARVYHGREAELQSRVSRARVRVVHADRGNGRAAFDIVRAFAAEARTLDEPAVGDDEGQEARCEPALVEHEP
jgi:coenzyme F420-reducing hydrogenase delta subunit